MHTPSPHYLLFSIDTESDAPEWKDHHHANLTFRNCEGIPLLLRFAERYGVRPTFLVTHAMANQKALHDALEPLLKQNICEVGAHFHPGDTPPFTNGASTDNVLRVSDDILNEKFTALQNQVSSYYGRPSSFRCGAWTIDCRIIQLLLSYGYEVDSSVTPSISWRLIGRPDYLEAPIGAYFLDHSNPSIRGKTPILEIPVTIWTPFKPAGPLGFIDGTFLSMPLESRKGVFFQCLKIVRRNKPLWLRPAFTTLGDMIFAARNVANNSDYIHVMCHSNELTLGTSPYSNTREKLDTIYNRLNLFFSFTREQGYIPLTLSEYARRHKTQPSILSDGSEQRGIGIVADVEKSQRRLRKPIQTHAAELKRPGIVKIALTIAILGIICLKVDLGHVWSKVLAMNIPLLAVAVLLTMLTHCLNALKVTLILPRHTLTLGRMMNINFMSTFFNNLFPTRFGGDFARVLYIGKTLSSTEVGLYAVLFDRLTGFLIQTIIVLVSCALLSGSRISAEAKHWCAAIAVVCLMASHGFLAFSSRMPLTKRAFGFPFSFLNRIIDHGDLRIFFKGLFENKLKHISIHVAGYIFQSCVIFTVMILTSAMGGSITFFEAAVVLFIGTMACFLPLSIGGWGVMEGVFAYLYNILHADAGVGLAVSLGLRITSVLPSLIGGFVFLKRDKQTV